MIACGSSLENPPSPIAAYLNNDNVNLYVGMEFNSITDVCNFYNAYVRRVGFGIIIVCSRFHKKKLCFRYLAC